MKAVLLSATQFDNSTLQSLLKSVTGIDWTMSCAPEIKTIALLRGMVVGKRDCHEIVRKAGDALKHITVSFGIPGTMETVAELRRLGVTVTCTPHVEYDVYLLVATANLQTWLCFTKQDYPDKGMVELCNSVKSNLARAGYSLVGE